VHWTTHVAKEGERVDRLGGEDAAIPAGPPAAVGGLDAALGQQLQLSG
jgi:hypothetical protein